MVISPIPVSSPQVYASQLRDPNAASMVQQVAQLSDNSGGEFSPAAPAPMVNTSGQTVGQFVNTTA